MTILTRSELIESGFERDAGGQWYQYSLMGNWGKRPENGSWVAQSKPDNHTHLMGNNVTPGYDPVTTPNPEPSLDVTRVELKLRAGDEIRRVWLNRRNDGKFDAPLLRGALTMQETAIAREMFALLPEKIRGTWTR